MKKINELSIAIFGCGRMGKTRAAVVRSLGGRIACTYDVDRSAALELSPKVLSKPEELVLDGLDVLFVCTPPGARGQVELEALKRGVAVLVEKPLAISAAIANQWAEAAEVGKAVSSVGYQNRYRPSVERVREAARVDGLLALSGVWACGQYKRDWWLNPDLSGGPLNEQMTHLVDLLRCIGGEVRSVSALGADGPAETATDAAVALTFTRGHIGTIAYSCRATEKSIGLRAVTPKRSLVLDGWDFRDEESLKDEDPFFCETKAFLEAVLSSSAERPRVDLAEAARTQAVVDAIRHSFVEGRRILID